MSRRAHSGSSLFGHFALAQVYAPVRKYSRSCRTSTTRDQPYALYVPKQYNAQKKYPLVISLHGEYSNHRLNLRRVFGKGNRTR